MGARFSNESEYCNQGPSKYAALSAWQSKKVGVRAYVPKSKIGQALVGALEAAVKRDDFIVFE
jgi:hypothetical protein